MYVQLFCNSTNKTVFPEDFPIRASNREHPLYTQIPDNQYPNFKGQYDVQSDTYETLDVIQNASDLCQGKNKPKK